MRGRDDSLRCLGQCRKGTAIKQAISPPPHGGRRGRELRTWGLSGSAVLHITLTPTSGFPRVYHAEVHFREDARRLFDQRGISDQAEITQRIRDGCDDRIHLCRY